MSNELTYARIRAEAQRQTKSDFWSFRLPPVKSEALRQAMPGLSHSQILEELTETFLADEYGSAQGKRGARRFLKLAGSVWRRSRPKLRSQLERMAAYANVVSHGRRASMRELFALMRVWHRIAAEFLRRGRVTS